MDSARGLSTARAQLRQRNFDVDILEISPSHPIPSDASLLMAVAPQPKGSVIPPGTVF